MQIEKWDIPGFPGQWAKIHRRATHGQAKAVTKDYVQSRSDGNPLLAETSVVRNLVEDWLVLGDGDVPIPFDAGDGVDVGPENIIKLIFEEAAGAMRDLFPSDETPSPNRAARRARAKS